MSVKIWQVSSEEKSLLQIVADLTPNLVSYWLKWKDHHHSESPEIFGNFWAFEIINPLILQWSSQVMFRTYCRSIHMSQTYAHQTNTWTYLLIRNGEKNLAQKIEVEEYQRWYYRDEISYLETKFIREYFWERKYELWQVKTWWPDWTPFSQHWTKIDT